MLWLPLLLLMPARGLGAVSEEARANTFDLVQLTRMTAFRIALGKWIALVAQRCCWWRRCCLMRCCVITSAAWMC